MLNNCFFCDLGEFLASCIAGLCSSDFANNTFCELVSNPIKVLLIFPFSIKVSCFSGVVSCTETIKVVDQGTSLQQATTKNLSFIQQPINFNATSNINYIFNNGFILGVNASYSLNSVYKTNYIRFNPLYLGVSLGFNINTSKSDKK